MPAQAAMRALIADERAQRYFAGMATHWTLGCDAADPHGIAAFWAIALGYVAEPGTTSQTVLPAQRSRKNRREPRDPPWFCG